MEKEIELEVLAGSNLSSIEIESAKDALYYVSRNGYFGALEKPEVYQTLLRFLKVPGFSGALFRAQMRFERDQKELWKLVGYDWVEDQRTNPNKC